MTDRSVEHSGQPHARASAAPAAFYAWTYRHLLFPTWQRVVRGRTIEDRLEEAEASQWLDREAIAALELTSLKRLLAHAGANIPYYRELFAKMGFDPRDVASVRDLHDLPLMTRELMRERAAELVDPAYRDSSIRKGTGGTSGVSLQFAYCNESETWRQAMRLRGYGWAGYRLGLPTVHYWGQPSALAVGLAAAKLRADRALRREVYVDCTHQDEESLREAVAVIRKTAPHVLVGYTQATATLARFVLDEGSRDWADISVICGAEAVLPGDRDAIERAFGPTFETYGSRETMLVAAECDAHDGMHVSEENLVVEIVSESGAPAAAGELGDVVVTDLHNYAMPFIRYVNGDVAAMSDDAPCRCGRGLRRLDRVDGRRCDTLRARDGSPIPGMALLSLLASKDGLVKEWQIVQGPSRAIVLKIVAGRDWSAPAFDVIALRMRALVDGLPFAVDLVDRIPVGASGKRRPVMVAASEGRS